MANMKATPAAKTAAAKKVEEAKETVKEATKAVAETKAEPAKVEEKAEKKTEKKAAPKKTVAKKAPAKKAPKAEAAAPEVYIQCFGRDGSLQTVEERIKAAFVEQGHRASSIKSMKVYLKPEEHSAYYVINDNFAGRVDLF